MILCKCMQNIECHLQIHNNVTIAFKFMSRHYILLSRNQLLRKQKNWYGKYRVNDKTDNNNWTYIRCKKKQNNSITCKTFVSILSKQTILPGCEKVDQTMHYVLAFLAKPADIIV